MEQEYDYDLFVIGGGSGGLSASKRASSHGLKVGLADFVKPSPQGTTWGVGGTCVNVGCIPKKLMHFAALLGELREDAHEAGWPLERGAHNWDIMRDKIKNHITQINWGTTFNLNKKKVKYHNALAKFIDDHTVELTDKTGKVSKVTAKNFLIAVGGRPNYPENLPNAKELCITSDDLFFLKKSPGKTLVVGGSYVALECAGFLQSLGHDTTVMVRSILLRGYDQDIAKRIGKHMANHGLKFIYETIPDQLEKTESGKIKATFKNGGQVTSEEYDTVLMAIGRSPDTKLLGLDSAGVKMSKTGKIIVSENDATSVPHIFAIGDVAEGRPEFTPTAVFAGKLFGDRIAGKGTKLMDYLYAPATVFTPIEYGCVGLSEDEALRVFGEGNFDVFRTSFKPLEWTYMEEKREEDSGYGKIITRKSDGRIVGFHFLGPNAGEVTQGYAVAIKKGITKEELDETVGIHPTAAEEMLQIDPNEEFIDGGCKNCG